MEAAQAGPSDPAVVVLLSSSTQEKSPGRRRPLQHIICRQTPPLLWQGRSLICLFVFFFDPHNIVLWYRRRFLAEERRVVFVPPRFAFLIIPEEVDVR